MSLNYMGVAIFVKNIEQSKNFYVNILKQKILFDHGPCIAFENTFSIWDMNHAKEIMNQNNSQPNIEVNRNSFELYFESQSLNEMEHRMTENKIDFVHKIVEQPWGQRCFRIYDPDNHIVEIGEPMDVVIKRYLSEGLTMEEISKRCSMPLEVVKQIAEN